VAEVNKVAAASMFDFSTEARRKEAWLFLETVWQGLEYLCRQVERAERERVESLGFTEGAAKNLSYCDFGSQPGDAMICNYFIWYASALYNFIGVFEKAFSRRENLKKEFRSVITWRHKVSAHTSWVRPKNDNVATQNMSILVFPEFSDGHFEVGGIRVASEADRTSCSDWRWGLVSTHEKLKAIVRKYA
jgi:hypothetical protein